MPEEYTLDILDASGEVVGMGLRLVDRQIVTNSHVVNLALGREARARNKPAKTQQVMVRFQARDDVSYPAHVARWQDLDTTDSRKRVWQGNIATLLINRDAPPESRLADLSTMEPEQQIEAFLRLPGNGAGNWVAGTIGRQAKGKWYVVTGEISARIAAEGGYSGSPIRLPGTDRIVGILTVIDTTVFAISAQTLNKWTVVPDKTRWAMNHFKDRTLPALTADIRNAQNNGIDDKACDAITSVLEKLAKFEPPIPENRPYYQPYGDQFKALLQQYTTWNNVSKLTLFNKDRIVRAEELRRTRIRIVKEIEEKQGVLPLFLDVSLFDAIHTDLRKSINSKRVAFQKLPRLTQAVNDYLEFRPR